MHQWEAELDRDIQRGTPTTPERCLEVARLIRQELRSVLHEIAEKQTELAGIQAEIEDLQAKQTELGARYNKTMAQLRTALDAEMPIKDTND